MKAIQDSKRGAVRAGVVAGGSFWPALRPGDANRISISHRRHPDALFFINKPYHS
ncbi:hypothetical protein [Caenibacillus caldisaponilyticus]|uniref:hypothetical protein n=1 Tax=Caenibacillus caldisaponilyticus TaxID=1674942 RepID=UPI0013018D4C|nr:hypothetical protein [Caenibacillus caldisaponilyticus]